MSLKVLIIEFELFSHSYKEKSELSNKIERKKIGHFFIVFQTSSPLSFKRGSSEKIKFEVKIGMGWSSQLGKQIMDNRIKGPRQPIGNLDFHHQPIGTLSFHHITAHKTQCLCRNCFMKYPIIY